MSKTLRHSRKKSFSESELDKSRAQVRQEANKILYGMFSENKLNTPQFGDVRESKILKLNYIKMKFQDVLDSEEIINDFSCALKKDLLLHGRLYIGLDNFYFHSNILSYETKVVEKWTNVISVEKAKLANIIPNSIKIVTTNAKYTFTSFVSRSYPFALINYALKNKKEQMELQSLEIRDIVKNESLKNKKSLHHYPIIPEVPTILNLEQVETMNEDLNSENSVFVSHSSSTLAPNIFPDIINDKIILQKKSENCSCHKMKHLVLNKVFKVNIDDIFNVLYDDTSFLMKDVYQRCNFKDYKLLSNDILEDGTIVKLSSTALPNAFLGKTAKTSLIQTFPNTNIPNEHYQVISKSKTQGVPFSDTFEVVAQSCLLKCDENTTFYKSWIEVNFVKQGWIIPKDKIEKSTVMTYRGIHDEIIKELSIFFGKPIDIDDNPIVSTDVVNEMKITEIVEIIKPPFKDYLHSFILLLMAALMLLMLWTIYKQGKTIKFLASKLSSCESNDQSKIFDHILDIR